MTWEKMAEAASGSVRERLGVAGATFGVIVVLGAVSVGSYMGCGTARKAAPVASFPARSAVIKTPNVAATPDAKPKKPAGGETLIVYVTGAVKRPGVYTLPASARLYHAIRAAGGFKGNAVTDALNLADRAQDGDQLCVPSRQVIKRVASTGQAATVTAPQTGFAPAIRKAVLPAPVALPALGSGDAEPPTVSVVEPPAPPARVLGTPNLPAVPEIAPSAPPFEGAATVAAPPLPANRPVSAPRTSSGGSSDKWKNPGDGVVHLNTATDADLQHLNRCGPAMSAKILAYRASIGRFTDVKQLMDVKGVGDKTFAKWEPFLAL